ncbi:hypothetical protein QYM36_013306 [Artemia franciscana]|uniref:Uncharacterized protein n=1 Tax=Artemia franciscana TaxID=6661 RepID=A0AA88KW80_ARTSF|nr:hypothetical protein QYM36_013306 [Artemia franciscana]
MKTICLVILVLIAVASAAPRKVVRRQAETAKPVGDKNGKVNQEEDKKADGAEEADERIRNSGFRRPIQGQNHLSPSTFQQGGFARPHAPCQPHGGMWSVLFCSTPSS